MEPFLKEVSREIVLKYENLKDVILILPNKRSGIFLKDQLLKTNARTTYAPVIYSIEEFIEKLAGLRPLENMQLLFEFYEVYKKEAPPETRDNFQDFIRWAQILLQDFSEIDNYLVDHKNIFSYLSSIKELNHWYLQEEKTEIQKNYIKFWGHLGNYYTVLKKHLLKKQAGYTGLLYREACNNTDTYLKNNPEKHHIFIGFNALNKAVEKMIQQFLSAPNNAIFWDIDTAFLSDNDHDAGLFIRSYKKTWDYFKEHDVTIVSDTFKNEKEIQIIGIPKTVGQAKYTGKLIDAISKKANAIDNTVVVLGNESLLMPLLSAIPEHIETVTISCGLPLHQTPVASFFDAFFQLTENRKKGTWYYKNVVRILSHPFTRVLLYDSKDFTGVLMSSIRQKNIVMVTPNDIKNLLPASLHQISDHLFPGTEKTVDTIIEHCGALIRLLQEKYRENTAYREYLYKFHSIFNRLRHLNNEYKIISDSSALKNMYRELLYQETIHFKGSSLKGLQIMGMLESRNLDFENVIITSVNEGILPAAKKRASFLPFEVKSAFQLPVYKEKDAVYTYHFYRLLQRAKNIYLLYNTEPLVLEGSEKSRFLLQLATQPMPHHTIKEIIASPKVSYLPSEAISIEKNDNVIDLLKNTAEKGFSPTSLSNYIRNPLDFYHRTVLGIKAEDEMEETITARLLGIVIHETLEAFYKPLEGKLLGEADIVKMQKEIQAVVSHHFMKLYKEAHFSRGKNLIGFTIVKRYIGHFLNLELRRIKSGKTIKILCIEKPLTAKITVPELGSPVLLKGTIDRVEEVDGIITIVDYKTGRVLPSDIEITNEEAITADYKYHKAFQLLSYACLYTKNHAISDKPLEAAVLSFKNLKSGYLKFRRNDKERGQKTTVINGAMLASYEDVLRRLLLEIFNPAIPFTENETGTVSFSGGRIS